MSTKPLACLTLLVFMFVHSAYSNGRFFPGYYIDKNGDSVACTIEYDNWYRNPGSIVVMVNNNRMTLKPTDIRRFGVTGYDEYQSASVTYHTNPIDGQDLPLEYSDKTITKDWFLRVMIRGTYSLFELTFADRSYYFISDQGGPVSELIFRAKTVDDVIILDEQYKSVLSELMTRENITDQDIAHLKYTPTKLAAVVNRLNQAHGGSRTVAVVPTAPKSKPLQLDIYAGGMLYAFPTPYPTVYGTGKMPSTISPEFGVGMRYIYPRSFGAWSLGLTFGYSSFKSNTAQSGGTQTRILSPTWYDSTYYSENQSVSIPMLKTNLYVMYIFTRRTKVNFYARAGVTMDYLLTGGGNSANAVIASNYTETSYLHAQSAPAQPDGSGQGSVQLLRLVATGVCYDLSAGVMLDRNRLELTYYSPMEFGAVGEPSFRINTFSADYCFAILK